MPFLFVTATSFQSSFQGATSRKVRQFFQALRKAARKHGGAVGFIDEFDAIGLARNGATAMTAAPATASLLGCGGLEGLPMTHACRAGDHQRAVHRRQRPADGGQRAARADAVLRRAHRRREAARQAGRRAQPAAARPTASCAARPASRPTSCSSPRPTAPTRSTRRCCARAASTGGSPSSCRPRLGRRQLIDHFLTRKAHARRARPGRAPRRAGRRHPGLQPGDDRGPARRGAGPGRARRARPR